MKETAKLHKSKTFHTKSRCNTMLFVHSALDEASLTASEFRVLAHIARRGECWASVGTVAKVCRLHKDTVRKSLKQLVKLGWLNRQWRTGSTTVYSVNHPKIREHPHPPTPRGGRTNQGGGGYETEGGKGNPIKVIQEACSFNNERALNFGETKKPNKQIAEKIYAAYPRKQHRPDALLAIEKSMIQHSPDHLLARTELFAAVVASGGNKKFVSLPARWFESEAFDDDPEEWARTTGATWGEVNAPRSATGQILEKWD